MTIIGRIVAFLIVLGVIVLVHEFGHYLAARLTHTRVEVFSFGFGKRLFGKRVGATDFRISLIPLGGYVRLAGEEDQDPDQARSDEFLSKNRGQRFLIMVMGAVMNMVLAVILITITHLGGIETDAYKLDPPVIGWVEPGSPAEKAGIQPGDRIERIGAHDTATW
ncbi:MAG TPA: site-2 protease family protein, partial [Candidatus Aminicenantes bacterium]|nr:site-2 protease family protein [Candidatus Aminicenantes bacterium]